jgi:hypothetical protein
MQNFIFYCPWLQKNKTWHSNIKYHYMIKSERITEQGMKHAWERWECVQDFTWKRPPGRWQDINKMDLTKTGVRERNTFIHI